MRQDGLPASTVYRAEFPESLTQLLVEAEMAASGKQVKDTLGRAAVSVNARAVDWGSNGDPAACFPVGEALFERFYLVKLGKKKYHLFEIL